MCLGYGFVKFKNPKDAANAIQSKNGMFLRTKRLKVSYARPPSDEIKNCKIYVTNLPADISKNQVAELFSQVSKVWRKKHVSYFAISFFVYFIIKLSTKLSVNHVSTILSF